MAIKNVCEDCLTNPIVYHKVHELEMKIISIGEELEKYLFLKNHF